MPNISSFAPVVLFLKVLLMQQDLDKPFTGGLGSYKLYVLVAHHVSIVLLLRMLLSMIIITFSLDCFCSWNGI